MTEPAEPQGRGLSRLYRQRFSDTELDYKRRLWETLCDGFFQRYVGEADTVLDVGAGTCEFINAIRAKEKIALDLNPDVERHLIEGRAIVAPATDIPLADASVDVVFSSNFFEHLPDKGAVLRALQECRRVLRERGTIITLLPNVRYLPGRYWDFFDHHTPLTHLSMKEALSLSGFVSERVVPRFLPYTVKGRRLPKSMALVRLYLRVPIVWPLFGRQMLLIGRRAA